MMRMPIIVVALIAALAASGFAVARTIGHARSVCSSASMFVAGGSCEAPQVAEATAHAGKVRGSFDPLMSGCRFSCATGGAHDPKDAVPQPGAIAGRLTQCPVSGVVFEVDPERPRVAVAGSEYVTCCDACAEKLRRDPGRFVEI